MSMASLQAKHNKLMNKRKKFNKMPFVMPPKATRDNKDYLDYVCEGKAWKNKTRKGAKIKQQRNYL